MPLSPPLSSVAVLLYHAVLAEGDSRSEFNRQDRSYAIGLEEFREHLDLVLRWGGKIVKIDAAAQPAASGAAPGMAITFDDSWRQHSRVAAPALLARGLAAVFFLTSGEIGRPYRLSADDVRQLAQLGFDIGSHGMSHRFFTTLRDDELRAELGDSRKRLEDCIGKPVRWLSLPGGRGNRRVVCLAAELGYEAIFGSRPGLWRISRQPPQTPLEIIPRICLRSGKKSKALLNDILLRPEETVKRLGRGDRLRRFLRFLIGDRLYHAAHGLFAGHWR